MPLLLAALALQSLPGSDVSWTVDPDDPFHRYAELELGSEPMRLAYAPELGTTLHVWVETRAGETVVLSLSSDRRDERVEGTTAYLGLGGVSPEEELELTLSSRSPGAVLLHVAAALETEATRAAADRANELVRAARTLREERRLGDAVRRLRGALAETGGPAGAAESDALGRVAFRIALEAYQARDHALALEASETAWHHFRRKLPDAHPERLSAAQMLGIARRMTGDPEGALPLEEEVLALRSRSGHPRSPEVLGARRNLAGTLFELGRLEEARTHYEAVLEGRLETSAESHPSVLAVRQDLAAVLGGLGDLEAARALGERVLAELAGTVPDDDPRLLRALQNLAVTRREAGDPAGARVLEERVLDTLLRLLPEEHPDVLQATQNLAVTTAEMGELEAALELETWIVSVLERARPGGRALLRARANLAVTLEELGSVDEANALLESVLSDLESILPADHPDLVACRVNLARVLKARGDLDRARSLEEGALAVLDRTVPRRHLDHLRARQGLAVTLSAAGDREGAARIAKGLVEDVLESIEVAAAALSRRELEARIGSEIERLGTLRRLLGSPGGESTADLFTLSETLRDATRLAARPAREDPTLRRLRREISRVRAELGDLAALPADDEREAARSIAELSDRRDALERRLVSELASRGARLEPVRVADVARSLLPGEVGVGFVRVPRFETALGSASGEALVAHVVRGSGQVIEVDLGDARELEELGSAWRLAIGEPAGRGLAVRRARPGEERVRGAELRSRLIDPLAILLDEGVQTLVVRPDDFLHALPLDALPLEDGGRLGDRLRVRRRVTLRPPATDRVAARNGTLVALGGVEFGAEGADGGVTFAPLPASAGEATAVADRFSATFSTEPLLLTGTEATKAAFERAAGRAHFAHVATHGWFDEPLDVPNREGGFGLSQRVRALSPMSRCGLALAGANAGRDELGRVQGILTAEEVAGFDLAGCELVVLSACRTHAGLRGAGVGLHSLQAALHVAGARRTITTLWAVGDAPARSLMTRFYDLLWGEGRAVEDALWETKVELRAAGAGPEHWAAWVLTES